jgi:biotin transport system substrate-specific component
VDRPRSFEMRDVTRIVVFAAILAVLGIPGAISVFGGAVPITAQTLGVMLAGAVLGPWRGAASIVIFHVLTLAGLPLLSGGRGGAGVYVGPSAGFLIGWIFGAFVVGAIVRWGNRPPTWWRAALGCFIGGALVVYAFGIPIQAAITHAPLGKTAWASAVFLPGDITKVVITAIITMTLWRAYPRAFGTPTRLVARPAVQDSVAP